MDAASFAWMIQVAHRVRRPSMGLVRQEAPGPLSAVALRNAKEREPHRKELRHRRPPAPDTAAHSTHSHDILRVAACQQDGRREPPPSPLHDPLLLLRRPRRPEGLQHCRCSPLVQSDRRDLQGSQCCCGFVDRTPLDSKLQCAENRQVSHGADALGPRAIHAGERCSRRSAAQCCVAAGQACLVVMPEAWE